MEINNLTVFPQDILKTDIKDFVSQKGKHYLNLDNITCFKIINVPDRLNQGKMTDDKLTFEEYALRDILHTQNAPFKLVDRNDTGFGLWQEGQCALIPLVEK